MNREKDKKNRNEKMKIILASGSPRRQDLMLF